MDIQRLIIREMHNGEQKALVKLGRKALPFVESLFVSTPKEAMVAEYEGTVIGCMMYQTVSNGKKKVVYIDQAFVDPDYHGMGVAKRLYTQTFRHIMEQGCDAITSLVKDDNIGSWKPCMDNGFERISMVTFARRIGFSALIKQCLTTPLLFGTGMDYYLLTKEPAPQKKKGTLLEAAAFFLINLLICLPIFIKSLTGGAGDLINVFLAAVTVLALFLLPRLAAKLLYRSSSHFRVNHCGSFVFLLVSLFGNIFPMNANWYPDVYENTSAFRRRLAIPELVKWGIFVLLPLLSLFPSAYFQLVAKFGYGVLLYTIIPVFPFESYGAGRIYRYSKVLWAVIAAISVLAMFFVY